MKQVDMSLNLRNVTKIEIEEPRTHDPIDEERWSKLHETTQEKGRGTSLIKDKFNTELDIQQ
jgi:hypothetical protein